MSLAVPIDDLIRWSDLTAQRWHDLAVAHPELLHIPCDIRNSQTVAELLQHIVAVELRYAERLASLPETDYNAVPYDSPAALLATHTRALNLVHSLLSDPAYDWSTEIEFQTITAGKLRATRRDILLHLLFHGIRHYAQLATLARTHGIKPDWPMDFLMVNAKRA